jgi:hypothetical protein
MPQELAVLAAVLMVALQVAQEILLLQIPVVAEVVAAATLLHKVQQAAQVVQAVQVL